MKQTIPIVFTIVLLACSPGDKPSTEMQEPHFIYVMIPEPLGPLDRGEKYEDPIEVELRNHNLGEITGGGSQLGDELADGSRPIEYCGIDVEVTDLDRGRELLRNELSLLGAPTGTQIHFTLDNAMLQDELQENGWVLDRPRTLKHPGFGI